MPRSYEEILKRFEKGWEWDAPNAAKFKLLEFIQWGDLPNDYRLAIIDKAKKEKREEDREATDEELEAEVMAFLPGAWDLENEYPLAIEPIITDIAGELVVANNLKAEMFQAAMYRLHRIYALVWILKIYPTKKLERMIKEGRFNKAKNIVDKILSQYSKLDCPEEDENE